MQQSVLAVAVDSLTVECRRPDLETTHVQVDVYPAGIAFQFGTLTPSGGLCFPVADFEFLSYSEYEETALLYQDGLFNEEELAAWIEGYEISATFGSEAA